MKPNPVVMISSTVRDLPEYRTQVMDACHRAGCTPKMMEHLPALPTDAIRASMGMVDQANVYVGVFAHRYGYVPEGHEISITHMEYERAVQGGIPRLIFVMHDDVKVSVEDIDFDNKPKLDKLKERLQKEQVVAFFRNPDDLRVLVFHSLVDVHKQLDTAHTNASTLAQSIHYVSDIPYPPEAYIAHPYTLLQVRRLVGRKEEMELLTDWVTGKRLDDVRIFSVVAIGGMGKSALTWTWFKEIAPQEMVPLAGRLWWSFYESDATLENFITRALAYVSRRTVDEVKKLSFPEREDQLLYILDHEPFLFALDGLERVLVAYARLDAAYLSDDVAIDEETANRVVGAPNLPRSASQSFLGKHKLRRTVDLHGGRFLRALARVRATRVLINTRLYPADLQGSMGDPLPGCYALFLTGLNDRDALALWRDFGAKGSREEMLPVFHTFDTHPLLIQLLAYEVAEFREAPGEFDVWKNANLDFNPFEMGIANVQSHILAQAMRRLSQPEVQTLQMIAAFRMPATIGALKSLLVRADGEVSKVKPFATFAELSATLTALEDRGLLGWDRRANRYDLHPIVRGVVWTSLDENERIDVYTTLRSHFQAMPMIKDYLKVESLDDLTPAIELYNTLIGLKWYEEAFSTFRTFLNEATLYRLSVSHLRVELLEALFPDGLDAPPQLTGPHQLSSILSALAQGYKLSGNLAAAIQCYQRADAIDLIEKQDESHSVHLRNMSEAFRVSGKLHSAEVSARAALIVDRKLKNTFGEGVSLYVIGKALGARGDTSISAIALNRSLRIWRAQGDTQGEGMLHAYLAEMMITQDKYANAKKSTDQAWEKAKVHRLERDLIRAARLQGTHALHTGDITTAGERLHHALLRARAVSLVEEELRILPLVSEWLLLQREITQARTTLEILWDPAERGPYPLFHADALNVLAQIERDEGNRDAAVEAATKAYRLAWCDGPPFAYHWGLEKAKAHLAALGAPEPEMPPFDKSKYEPMSEVEINPPDEFSGEDEADDDEA